MPACIQVGPPPKAADICLAKHVAWLAAPEQPGALILQPALCCWLSKNAIGSSSKAIVWHGRLSAASQQPQKALQLFAQAWPASIFAKPTAILTCLIPSLHLHDILEKSQQGSMLYPAKHAAWWIM